MNATRLTLVALSMIFVVGCGDSEKKSTPKNNSLPTLQDVGFKPGSSGPSQRMDTFKEGIYRLSEVRVLTSYDLADLDPNSRTVYKLSMAATQNFQVENNKKKYEARLSPLRRALESNDPSLGQRDAITVFPQMKLPLTLRIREGGVSFEQIRMLWICMKSRGACTKENYLSLGRSTTNDVIHPALYLFKKGYSPTGEDSESHLKALRSGTVPRSNGTVWVEMESTLADDARTTIYIRLLYSADGAPREQDLVGNADEESLQGPDPAP